MSHHGSSASVRGRVGTASVLLVGNPNVGKSTLFNTLTRAHQKVVNAPGTTVELAQGTWRLGATELALTDLPGTYSLIARSPDEQVVTDAMARADHDLAIVVVDATALSRSLYLLGQVASAGSSVVVALTMADIARSRGLAPAIDELTVALGVPVIEVHGRSGAGLPALSQAVEGALEHPRHVRGVPTTAVGPGLGEELALAQELFDWVETITDAVLPETPARATATDAIDRVLLNPWAGIPVFLAVIWGVFQLTTAVAAPLMGAVTGFVGGPVSSFLGGGLLDLGAPAWLESFVVDGLLAGIGAVLAFVPLMALIFMATSVLESTGYLARVAVVANRGMRAIGLDGRAMLPLIVGFGCNVPALSATAVLPHARQRLLTGLLVPLTSCTARLTVYLLLAQAFFPGQAGTVVFAMYVGSVLLVIGWGLVMRRTVLRDARPDPLVIALPDYQLPHLHALLTSTINRVWSFVRKAGSIIVLVMASLWVLQAIPLHGDAHPGDVPVADSLYGAAAQAVAPSLAPLGLDDWRVASSLLSGVAAKEVVVGALAQSYALDDPTAGPAPGAANTQLAQSLRATVDSSSGGAPGAAGLAFMIFTMSYVPCLATMAEQRRLFGWRWTAGAVGAQFVGAYLIAMLVFQVGRLL